MKKILLIALALTTVLGLVACTNTENTVNSDTVATDTGSIQLAPADVVDRKSTRLNSSHVT